MHNTTRPSPKAFLALSAKTASFYGFRSVRELEQLIPRKDRTRAAYTFGSTAQLCASIIASRPAISRQEPLLAYYATATPNYLPAHIPSKETGEFGLAIIGSQESISEVLLIKVVVAILQEWGMPVTSIRINALGDRDNQQRFARELALYLRKHAPVLEAAGETGFAENPLAVYRQPNEKCQDILLDAPRSINFLSEKSRTHFRSVLEQLEMLQFPYQLDDTLVSDEREPRILFSIDSAQEDMTIYGSVGGRYDDFVKRTTGRKETATVHASIFFKRKGIDRASCGVLPKATPTKIYFVQLGARAKLQGLSVIDMLRTAHIRALQSFDCNHLGEQLAAARASGVSHVLIMGQREVLDGTIIIRSADERTQSTIQLSQLPKYLKTLQTL